MRQLILVLALALCAGCGSDSNPVFQPDADVDGRWTFSANPFDPPEAFACSGGHTGFSGTNLCSPFDLDLAQNGTAFTGSSSGPYCGFDWTVTGTVNGTLISGTIVLTDGMTTQRITFTGVVSANSALLDPERLSEDGLSGDCTVVGFYNASR